MTLNKLLQYKDRHKGQTLFIFGAGYGLDTLTEEEINKIKSNYTSIGCNQSYLKIKSNYYIAGHFHHSLMQYHFGGEDAEVIFQGEPQNFYTENKTPRTTTLTSINIVGQPGNLPLPTENSITPLIGAEQIGFSSTHLAYIMGAKNIVYVGFDFSARGHFYNQNEKLKQTAYENGLYIQEKYSKISPLIDEDINDFFTFNFRNDINDIPFKNTDYITNKFKSYIQSLHSLGVNTYTLHPCILNNFGSQIYNL